MKKTLESIVGVTELEPAIDSGREIKLAIVKGKEATRQKIVNDANGVIKILEAGNAQNIDEMEIDVEKKVGVQVKIGVQFPKFNGGIDVGVANDGNSRLKVKYNPTLKKLEKLAELKQNGVITESEFEEAKRSLLSKI